MSQPKEQARFDELLQSEKYAATNDNCLVRAGDGSWPQVRKVAAILAILEDRFGSLPMDLRQPLESCPEEKIPELIKRVSKADSLDDLVSYDFDQ